MRGHLLRTSVFFVSALAAVACGGNGASSATRDASANGADAGPTNDPGSTNDAGSANVDSDSGFDEATDSSRNAPADSSIAADSGTGGGSDAGPNSNGDGGTTGDGFANAPDCTIQHPSLLDGYAVRPSWKVAGVDYCVGYPTSTALKDPATIQITDVTVDTMGRTVTLRGAVGGGTADNVTLDGYDFSRGGGWSVAVIGATNTAIKNSYFLVDAEQGSAPIWSGWGSTNVYVGYCVIDGGGAVDPNITPGTLINAGANLTVEYSWFKNSPADMIDVNNGGDVIIRNNLIEQAGQATGTHPDYLQDIGGPYTFTVVYNTTYQSPGGMGTQGLMLEPDVGNSAGSITGGEMGHNTMMAVGSGDVNFLVGVTSADVQSTLTVHDNYVDLTGAFDFARAGSSSARSIFSANVNMVTGQMLPNDY